MLPRATCRVCGDVTRYNVNYQGLISCDKLECKAESRRRKNAAIQAKHLEDYASGKRQPVRGTWDHVERISPEEKMLNEYLAPLGWINQHKFVPFVRGIDAPRTYWLDFALPSKKLCVEIDGKTHGGRRDRDVRRDEILALRGWQTLRITNEDVHNSLNEAVSLIVEWGETSPTIIDEPELAKNCAICGIEMSRPENVSPHTWNERQVCSRTCQDTLHAASMIGQPSLRKGIPNKIHGIINYIPCRICGRPSHHNGTPAHPRWGKVSCNSPKCVEASKQLMLQARSAALKGNQKLIESTKAAWDRRKTEAGYPSNSVDTVK